MQEDLQPILQSLAEAAEIMNKARVTAHERRYVRSMVLRAERLLRDVIHVKETVDR